MHPHFTGLLRLFQVFRHLRIISSRDPELLPVAGTIPQLIGFAGALRRERSLAKIAVHAPQPRIGHGEFGSISMARLKRGRAASSPDEIITFKPVL